MNALDLLALTNLMWKQHHPLVATTLSKIAHMGNNTIQNGSYGQQHYPPKKWKQRYF